MADASITVEGVLLYDNWPGVAVEPPVPVTDITSAAVGHNAAKALWPVGTKWQLYCNGDQASVGVSYRQGFSTVIYLKAAADAATAIATVLTVGAVPDSTIVAASNDDILYTMLSDPAADHTTHEWSGLFAVGLSTVTNSYYCWYWCGGVYPVEYVASGAVADDLDTDDSVVLGSELALVTTATHGVGVGQRANNTSQCPAVGLALIAD